MKLRLVKPAWICALGCGALAAAPAFAQVSSKPAEPAAAAATASAQAGVPKPPAAGARVAAPASARTITAAGSVIVILADGIVANATHAQIDPPAPGFVYER